MRTVIRHSRPLNDGKWKIISSITRAFASEKDKWLCELARVENIGKVSSDRVQRDILVKSKYVSPFGLQARQWKQALKDGVETLDKNWKALFVEIVPLIMQNANLTKVQKHYCCWALKSYDRLQGILSRCYVVPEFEISRADLRHAGNYLNRTIRRHKGSSPRVRRARSFCLDADMYNVFERDGAQYISIMTLQKHDRLTIPLLGNGKITGNLRIVLDHGRKSVRIHQSVDIKSRWVPDPEVSEAIDFGYTEAFTDSEGKTYGDGLGEVLTTFSDKLNATGKARNKLHSLQKKYREEGKAYKVKNIKTFNLGFQKKDSVRHKAQTSVENKVNNGLNILYKSKRPKVLISEDLRHTFTFDKPKGVNRKLSIWMKGIIQDRTEFKALEGRSLHKQVNPAYGSQTCPECGFLWSLNRKGDKFKCLFCKHEASSDKVAAINYLHRSTDTEISLFVPYGRVREILMERFLRRLECDGLLALPSGLTPETRAYIMKEWDSFMIRSAEKEPKRTVPGRTADTGGPHSQGDVEDASRMAGGFTPVNTAPVNRRAKQAIPKAGTYSNVG